MLPWLKRSMKQFCSHSNYSKVPFWGLRGGFPPLDLQEHKQYNILWQTTAGKDTKSQQSLGWIIISSFDCQIICPVNHNLSYLFGCEVSVVVNFFFRHEMVSRCWLIVKAEYNTPNKHIWPFEMWPRRHVIRECESHTFLNTITICTETDGRIPLDFSESEMWI